MRISRLSIVKRLVVKSASLVLFVLLFWCLTLDNPTHATPEFQRTGSTSPASSAVPGPTPPAAGTSISLVSADPRFQYFLIKRTYAEMWPAFEVMNLRGDPFDLESCYYADEDLDTSEDNKVGLLATLAHDVVRLRKNLTRHGYPESVWRPLLLQFEEEQLVLSIEELGKPYSAEPESPEVEPEPTPAERHRKQFLRKMARALRSYRRRTAPTLPEIYYEGGCGAGGVGVNIRTEPANGRVIFIPVFFYRLCKAQQIDPDDVTQCDRWREPAEGILSEVSGDYFYRASWPDGVEKRGRFSFTHLKDDETVTIRKP